MREIRNFGRAAEGSNDSPLTNTMGGLSGGGLKKKLDYISQFAHVILAPVHAILLCTNKKSVGDDDDLEGVRSCGRVDEDGGGR